MSVKSTKTLNQIKVLADFLSFVKDQTYIQHKPQFKEIRLEVFSINIFYEVCNDLTLLLTYMFNIKMKDTVNVKKGLLV